MRQFLIAIAFCLASTICTAKPAPAQQFHVTVGKGAKPVHGKFGATVQAGTLTVNLAMLQVFQDGSWVVAVTYRGTDGAEITTHRLTLDPSCTKLTDDRGGVVYQTSGPSDALCAAQTGLMQRLNDLIGTCAASGSLNL